MPYRVSRFVLLRAVTDAGLKHLKALSGLQNLSLNGTHVTATGIAGVQKTLPNCEISR